MNVKNSIWGMRLLLDKISSLKQMLSGSKGREIGEKFVIDLQNMHAESKRIAEKLQDTEKWLMQCKSENKFAGDHPGSANDFQPVQTNEELLCGWREDGDDRYRENNEAHKTPERTDECLKTLFQADHDAAQLEQYELENNLSKTKRRRKKLE